MPKRKSRKLKQQQQHFSPRQSTQQNISVRDFYRGCIVTKDKRYLKILEIEPTAFLMQSPERQFRTAVLFANAIRLMSKRVQFISITLPADLGVQIEKLRDDIDKEHNSNCLEIAYEYMDMLETAQEETTSRRYFIVISCDKTGTVLQPLSPDDAVDDLNRIANQLVSALGECGNSIKNLNESNYDAAEILYTFYNRDRYLNYSFDKHLAHLYSKYTRSLGYYPEYIPASDCIAAELIDYRDPKMIKVNDTYYSHYYIASNGYPEDVVAGWLVPFLVAGNGVDVSMHIERLDSASVVSSLRRNTIWAESDILDSGVNSAAFDTNSEIYQAGNYLKDGVQAGWEFCNVVTIISISGKSLAEVNSKAEYIKALAKRSDIKLRLARNLQEEAFNACLPLNTLDPAIYRRAKQNMLSLDFGSMYPFVSYEMQDDDGICVGLDQSGSPVILDLFNTKRFTNANLFIAGISGAGKTYNLLMQALRMRIKHIPIFILAPDKQHEFKRACEAMGGQFIEFSIGSPNRINVMEILERNKEASNILDGIDESSLLAEKIRSLKVFFSLLFHDEEQPSIVEKQVLDNALVRAYAKYGITKDNKSLIDPETGHYKKMPIIADVVEELEKEENGERLKIAISFLVSGSGSSFNGETNVDLQNDFTVIGLEKLDKDLLPLGMYMAMDFVWSKVKEDRTKKKAIVIDEWWKLARHPIGMEYSLEIAKTIRAYGGSMILATQDVGDIFADEDVGKGVINNCSVNIFMMAKPMEAQRIKELMGLNDTEANEISPGSKGHGILIASDLNIPIDFQATSAEHRLLTTDRNDLSKIVAERNIKENNSKNPIAEQSANIVEKTNKEHQDKRVYQLFN